MGSLEIIYKNEAIVKMVQEAVDNAGRKITNTDRLEERIYRRISRYIEGCEKRARHYSIIRKFIYESISEYEKRYRTENSVPFSELESDNEDDGDKELEFEPIDVLANVESETIAKEMTALLAQDDHRKKIILGNWITGNDNVSDIARLLAQTIGGSVETHRKYIHRFQKECRKFIAA